MLRTNPLPGPEGEAAGARTRSPARIGVEEEFLLHDPRTGLPAARASEMIEALGSQADRARTEMHATQLELVTEPTTGLQQLSAALLRNRKQAIATADDLGMRLLAVGLHPAARTTSTPAREPRYEAMLDHYGDAAATYQGCGTHVHVEVPDRDAAALVLGHVAPWIPLLVALGSNSACSASTDTGFASWRIALQRRFPLSGLPPVFDSAAHYDATIDTLVDQGVLRDAHTSFWLARLSDHYPTIEFRAADVGLTADDSALQAALCRSLVMTALADVERGIEPPVLHPAWADSAVWMAARHGIDGPIIDPVSQTQVPIGKRLADFLAATTDALCEAGDYQRARTMLAGLQRRGTGAQVHRRAGCAGIEHILAVTEQATAQPDGLGHGGRRIMARAREEPTRTRGIGPDLDHSDAWHDPVARTKGEARMTNDVEKRYHDPKAFRRAAAYVLTVVIVALALMGGIVIWGDPRESDAAAMVLALAPSAIILVGFVGAFVQAYRTWRRGGTWPIWQGAGWFLLMVFLVYAALSLTVIGR